MENKNTLGLAYSGDINVTPVNYAAVQPKRKQKLLIILGIVLFVALLAGGLVWALFATNNRPSSSVNRFNNAQIDLSGIIKNENLPTLNDELTILGQLNISGGFTITPTNLPANPKAGQLYYDKATNVLNYYNGSTFVGLDGVTELQVGAGLVQADGVLSNTGVLSLQGLTGNIALTAGPGISIDGTTISADVTASGVLSLTSGSPSLAINNDGNGNLTITSSGGGTGNVQTPGGTANRLAKFTGVETIADSIISDDGALVTIGGGLAVTNNLSVGGSLTLATPLSVASGGTGRSSLTANGVLVGQGASAITTVTAGGSNMCLKSTGGLPIFDPCVVNTEAVTQINGLTGSLTINNASGLVDEITIDDASTVQKGIAQFNNTNFTAGSGIINTVQNIHSGATPTFAGLTLNGALSMGANNITGSNFGVQGSSGNISTSGTITSGLINGQTISSSASFTGSVTVANDLTLSAGDLAVNGGNITSTAGLNVTATGNLTLAASGASDILLQTNGNTQLIIASTGDLTGTGNLTLQGGTLTVGTSVQAGVLELNDGDGDIATIQLGIAGLSGNQVYTLPDVSGVLCLDTGNCAGSGTGVTTSGGSTNHLAKFSASQNIEDSTITDDGSNVTTSVDVIIQGGDLTVGTSSQLASLILHDGNGQTTTLQAGDTSGSLTFILPTTAGTANQCLKQSGVGNQLVWDACDGGGGGVSTTLQNAYSNGNTITTSDARDISITLADTSTDSNLNVTIADGSTSFVAFSRANGTGTSDPAQLLLVNNLDTDRAVPVGIKLQSAAGGMTTAIDATDAEITDALSVAANNIVGTTGNIDFSNFDIVGATGDITTSGDLAVNGGNITSTAGLSIAAAGGDLTLDASGNINLQDSTNVSGNLDISGTLAVGTGNAFQVDASGDITTSGDLAVNGGNITSTGPLSVGGSSQALTLLSSGGGNIQISDSGNTTTINFATPTANTTITFPALGAGSYEVCTDGGNCSTGTLQDAYDNSVNPELVLSAANGALTIRDNSSALGADLLQVQSNDGAVTYFAATDDGISVTGSVEASSNIVTTTGALIVDGQTRLDNSGNLTNIGNLSLSGSISGGTTYSGSGDINTTGGAVQTNSTDRINNNGDLVNIGSLTATGAITIASTGAGNDVVINGADQFIVQDASVFNGTATFNTEVDLALADTENLDISTVVSGTNGVNLINIGLTNNSASGTQQVAFLQNVGGSGQTETLLALDNADTDTAVTSGIIITSAAGGIATALDVSDSDIGVALLFGANNIDGTNFDIDGATGNITLAGTINTSTLTGSALTFGAASTATISAATSQALNIVAHGTSTWTTNSGNITIDTTASGGTLNVGTGAQNKTVNVGTTNGTSTTNIRAGTGGISITSGANITIGASDTTGTLLIVDTMTGDTNDPTGTNGAIYYNDDLGRFRCHQNGSWGNCDGGASAAEYLHALQSVSNTTNLTTADHVKFNTVMASSGSSIALNTGSYASGGGRFTLAAGKTYRLRGQISRISSAGDQVNYQWYNVTTGSTIGTNGYTSADGGPETDAEAIISTSQTTVVEIRYGFIDATQIVSGDVFGLPGPTAYIEVLSDGTLIAQFQGATASADGQAGFIPAPVAGQQNTLLLGDGTWSDGLGFLRSGSDYGLQVTAAGSSYLDLNGDSDNDGGETGTAYIRLAQDGGASAFYIGTTQTASQDPLGNSVTGANSNSLFIGTPGGNRIQFANGGVVRLTIDASGNITVGNSDTTGTLLVLDTKTDSGDPTGTDGAMYYNSNAGKFRCREAGSWVDCIGSSPVGAISLYAGSSAPTGWLLADGSAVSRTTYSALFAVIGTTYGSGNGSTTFNLPDLRGRQATGRNSGDTSYDTLGETGGEKTHTLTTGEMPSHTHSAGSLTTNSTGAHTHNVGADNDGNGGCFCGYYTVHNGGSSGAGTQQPTSSAGAHSHTISGSTGSAGSGTAHNVLDPYIVVNYVIKY